jgi:hydroxyacylglutathione hydrolase
LKLKEEEMLFRHIYDDDLAQASYLIGCQKTGTAVVIDPRRDIGVYLETAQHEDMQIVAVTETHIHADYLSGARELAHATGATLYLSNEGGPDWQYTLEHEALHDGSRISVGNVMLEVLHTPGHTPEHLSFLITDGANATQPGFILTGDFVFVGDIGRPDLLDEAAGGLDTRFEGAKQMFLSLKNKFLTLPDYVQVWPGHGAGSACGKALGAMASTTVGYERRFAWWRPYLEQNDLEGFTSALLEGQLDAPTYFGRMKRQNRTGPALLGSRARPVHHAPADIASGLKLGAVLLIDTRTRETFQSGTAPGSLHLPDGRNFVTWAGWLIDPERDEREIVLLAHDRLVAARLRDALARVGIDRVVGFVSSLDGLPLEPQHPISPTEALMLEQPFILDVRTRTEFEGGHIQGAVQLHAGRLMQRLERVPRDRTVLVYCQSGARSAVAISALRSAGFANVLELAGGFEAWAAAQPVPA